MRIYLLSSWREATVIQTKEDDEIGTENIDWQSSHDYKFSEVLIEMDKNTVKYMMEEQQRDLEQLEQKRQELEQKDQKIADMKRLIEDLQEKLSK